MSYEMNKEDQIKEANRIMNNPEVFEKYALDYLRSEDSRIIRSCLHTMIFYRRNKVGYYYTKSGLTGALMMYLIASKAKNMAEVFADLLQSMEDNGKKAGLKMLESDQHSTFASLVATLAQEAQIRILADDLQEYFPNIWDEIMSDYDEDKVKSDVIRSNDGIPGKLPHMSTVDMDDLFGKLTKGTDQ